MKTAKILVSAAVAAVFLSPHPASAQPLTAVYGTTFYSTSGKTQQIGQLMWTGCDNNSNPTFHLVGRSSVHTIDEHIGYCYGDQMQPL
ncbi:MAG TPA: hypothetical protein VE891_07575 [Allosphingosinicella sp.]|nr:hypothetical protein [Allosphingosinicella sp.]